MEPPPPTAAASAVQGQPAKKRRRGRTKAKTRKISVAPDDPYGRHVQVHCVYMCGVVYKTPLKKYDLQEWTKTLRRVNAHESKRCRKRPVELHKSSVGDPQLALDYIRLQREEQAVPEGVPMALPGFGVLPGVLPGVHETEFGRGGFRSNGGSASAWRIQDALAGGSHARVPHGVPATIAGFGATPGGGVNDSFGYPADNLVLGHAVGNVHDWLLLASGGAMLNSESMESMIVPEGVESPQQRAHYARQQRYEQEQRSMAGPKASARPAQRAGSAPGRGGEGPSTMAKRGRGRNDRVRVHTKVRRIDPDVTDPTGVHVHINCVNMCGVVYRTPTKLHNALEWGKTLRRVNAHESKRCRLRPKATPRAAAENISKGRGAAASARRQAKSKQGPSGTALPEAELYRVMPEPSVPRIIGGVVNSATVALSGLLSERALAPAPAPRTSANRVAAASAQPIPGLVGAGSVAGGDAGGGGAGVGVGGGGGAGASASSSASASASASAEGSPTSPATSPTSLAATPAAVAAAAAAAAGAAEAKDAASLASSSAVLAADTGTRPRVGTGAHIRPDSRGGGRPRSRSATATEMTTSACMVCHNSVAPFLLDLGVCKTCAALAGKVRCSMCNTLHSSAALRNEICAMCVAMKERFQDRAIAAHNRGPT